MPLDYAIKTVSYQFAAVLASFMIGLCACVALMWGSSFINIATASGESYLFLGSILGPWILCALIFLITYAQFTQALTAKEVVKKSIQYAFYVAIVGSIANLFFIGLAIIYDGASFIIVLIEIAGVWVSTYLSAVIVGIIQAWRLHLERFNKHDHMVLINEKGRFLSLKQGSLPYTEQVTKMWYVIFATLFALFFFLMLLSALFLINLHEIAPILGLIIFILFFGALAVIQWNSIEKPQINSVETLLKRKEERKGRHTLHVLICDKQELFVDDILVWRMLHTGQMYRFWFSERDKVVLRYEKL